MNNILLLPPITFIITLTAIGLFSAGLSRLSFKPKTREDGSSKSYACGENVPTHLMQPDYTAFFPFAFLFTILHVMALIIATVPIESLDSFSIALTYLLGAVVAISILFGR